MRSISFVLISFLISLTICSCNKENSVGTRTNNGTLISEVISAGGDSTAYTFFVYDSQNRLVSIIDSNSLGTFADRTTIFYDQSGLPSGYSNNQTWSFIDPIGTYVTGLDTFSFRRDGLGRIVGKTETDRNPAHFSAGYLYDNNSNLIADSEFALSPKEIHYLSHFSYTGNDDLSEIQELIYAPGTLFHDSVDSHVLFDSNPSAYGDIFQLYFVTSGLRLLLGKHNPTQMSDQFGEIEYLTYEYDKNNIPVNVRISFSYQPQIINSQFIYK